MGLSREQMLVEMGIAPLWALRQPLAATLPAESGNATGPASVAADLMANVTADVAASVVLESPAGPEAVSVVPTRAIATVDRMDWPELTEAVAQCRACPLCQQRRQAVLGVGDRRPDWLFIGEGPGAEEDARGEPFVGQAGKLLDAMLTALGLQRGDKVYIGNAVKCRPPGNRTPDAAEMAACRPYLERQIALLQPKIIVLLGKAAVHSLLREDKTLGTLRGKLFDYAGIPVVVSYHPAYLLRNLPDKAKAWEDLLFARRTLRQSLQRSALTAG